MSTNDSVPTRITFEAPGPGTWELDATHRGRRPVSQFAREPLQRGAAAGTAVLMERYGLPLESIRVAFVNGCAYMRPTALGEGSKPKPPPPTIVMKMIARLHPELRRRTRTANAVWAEKRWRQEVDQWFDGDRAQITNTNLELQAVELAGLDDAALAAHVRQLTLHFETQARLNMETHGGDLIPVGDYLAHCGRWGISGAEATALLAGSSPATIETAELLAPVAAAIAGAEVVPDSVESVRALEPDVADAVDSWLRLHAWRLVTTDDIDKPTLAERPALQLAALQNALKDVAVRPAPDPTAVRDQVPATARAQFDELLAEARYGMRQRDDIVGIRWNWSGGLLRRALLEVGGRLVSQGRLEDAGHIVELSPDEAESLFLRGDGPSAAEAKARAELRDQVEASNPPDMLGEPEAEPPLDAFPPAMARVTEAIMTVLEAEGLAAEANQDPLAGVGVGVAPYRGVARVATGASDALDNLQPGEVLVAPFTGPSYNSILPMVGALVVEAGGTMCHAAIAAREFAIPAVIGAAGASAAIVDGAMVEVDPVAGKVRVISSPSVVASGPDSSR